MCALTEGTGFLVVKTSKGRFLGCPQKVKCLLSQISTKEKQIIIKNDLFDHKTSRLIYLPTYTESTVVLINNKNSENPENRIYIRFDSNIDSKNDSNNKKNRKKDNPGNETIMQFQIECKDKSQKLYMNDIQDIFISEEENIIDSNKVRVGKRNDDLFDVTFSSNQNGFVTVTVKSNNNTLFPNKNKNNNNNNNMMKKKNMNMNMMMKCTIHIFVNGVVLKDTLNIVALDYWLYDWLFFTRIRSTTNIPIGRAHALFNTAFLKSELLQQLHVHVVDDEVKEVNDEMENGFNGELLMSFVEKGVQLWILTKARMKARASNSSGSSSSNNVVHDVAANEMLLIGLLRAWITTLFPPFGLPQCMLLTVTQPTPPPPPPTTTTTTVNDNDSSDSSSCIDTTISSRSTSSSSAVTTVDRMSDDGIMRGRAVLFKLIVDRLRLPKEDERGVMFCQQMCEVRMPLSSPDSSNFVSSNLISASASAAASSSTSAFSIIPLCYMKRTMSSVVESDEEEEEEFNRETSISFDGDPFELVFLELGV